jgi:hypothetical protein
MNFSRYLIVAMSLVAATSVPSNAADDSSEKGPLSVAKMAGGCAMLNSMIQLQKTTKLPGGDEFVSRFWSVEAARLGYSVDKLSSMCRLSEAAFNRMWAAADSKQAK